MKVAIVGGGAAGCFCAVNLKRKLPSCEVYLFEAGKRTLAKVAVTGGGRCNLTNTFSDHKNVHGGYEGLERLYPRGTRLMKRMLMRFGNDDTCRWFESEGIRLTTMEDGCVFPASQDAMEIVGKLNFLMKRLGVRIHTLSPVESVKQLMKDFDAVVVAVGGKPSENGYGFLDGLGLKIVAPCPSLYTFDLRGDGHGASPIGFLSGNVVKNCTVGISGTNFKASGELLITDWGVSGPAILKLSSYAARYMADNGFKAELSIAWGSSFTDVSSDSARAAVLKMAACNPGKQVLSTHPSPISSRLWRFIVSRAGLREDIRWKEVGSKGLNRLVNTLLNDTYTVCGKGRYKDEFVTCGGVALSEINQDTLESKKYPGLYFAGEILDVDAITGGFNLQAAWSMGYVAAGSIASSCKSAPESSAPLS